MFRLLVWCTVFAAAFGVVEAAVVVYLRELYYPAGFAFPLRAIAPRILATELVREAATLLLLLGVAVLARRRGRDRFAVFAFCFGVWDLVYYLGLLAVLGWPPSLLTWDVLFLIPVPWTAPVLAPVLVSVALIGAAVVLLARPALKLRGRDWGIAGCGGVLVLASFFWNTAALAAEEAPRSYPWWLFTAGFLLATGWFARCLRQPCDDGRMARTDAR